MSGTLPGPRGGPAGRDIGSTEVFGGQLRLRALLTRQCGAVVRQDGSLMRCRGGRMTTRLAAAVHSPLVQHSSRYSPRACDAVTCRREES